MVITGLATSIVVNALVTGLIVFKILKVFLQVNPILVELTLSSIGGEQTPARRIRHNRVRHDVVCHPSDSHRVLDPANGLDC